MRRLSLLAAAMLVASVPVLPAHSAEPRTPRQPRAPRQLTTQTQSTAPSTSTAPASSSLSPLAGHAGIESSILSLVNGGRRANGKASLRSHAGLQSVARQHSRNMAARGALTHAGFVSRLNQGARGWSAGCENVARFWQSQAPSAAQVASTMYRLWLNSPTHRRCMFDQRNIGYTHAGVGVYRDSRGGWWATLELARF